MAILTNIIHEAWVEVSVVGPRFTHGLYNLHIGLIKHFGLLL